MVPNARVRFASCDTSGRDSAFIPIEGVLCLETAARAERSSFARWLTCARLRRGRPRRSAAYRQSSGRHGWCGSRRSGRYCRRRLDRRRWNRPRRKCRSDVARRWSRRCRRWRQHDSGRHIGGRGRIGRCRWIHGKGRRIRERRFCRCGRSEWQRRHGPHLRRRRYGWRQRRQTSRLPCDDRSPF